MLRKKIPAGKFKAGCLKIMDEVQRTKVSITITKRNIPIVEMVPIKKKTTSGLGWMKGTAHSKGDIIESLDMEEILL